MKDARTTYIKGITIEKTNKPRSTYAIPKIRRSILEYFIFLDVSIFSSSYNPSPSFIFFTTKFTKINKITLITELNNPTAVE